MDKKEPIIYRESSDPPQEMFEIGAPTGENQILNVPYRADFPEDGGVHIYRHGDMLPQNGWPFKRAVYAVDILKRAVMNSVKFLTALPLNILKGRVMHSAIVNFADFAKIVFDHGELYWKPQYFCTMVREVRRVGNEIAGTEVREYQWLVQAICMMLEFDDGYRYRVQDMIETIDKEATVRNPRKEFVRVLRIAATRGDGTLSKFEHMARMANIVLMIPSFKRTMSKFFELVDIEKLYLDERDWYKCLIWTGHKFRGIPDRERLSLRMMIDAEWMHRENIKSVRMPEGISIN